MKSFLKLWHLWRYCYNPKWSRRNFYNITVSKLSKIEIRLFMGIILNPQLMKKMVYDGISIFEIRSFMRWPVIEICVYAFKSKNFHFLENYIVLHLTLKLEWWCKGNICVFDYLFSFFREFNFCYVFITSISLSVCMYVNCRSCKYTPNGWKMLQDCKLFYRIFPIEIRVYLTKNLCIGMDKRIRIQNI